MKVFELACIPRRYLEYKINGNLVITESHYEPWLMFENNLVSSGHSLVYVILLQLFPKFKHQKSDGYPTRPN